MMFCTSYKYITLFEISLVFIHTRNHICTFPYINWPITEGEKISHTTRGLNNSAFNYHRQPGPSRHIMIIYSMPPSCLYIFCHHYVYLSSAIIMIIYLRHQHDYLSAATIMIIYRLPSSCLYIFCHHHVYIYSATIMFICLLPSS